MKKVYIWGTGCEAEKCIQNINLEICQIAGYIETNPQKTIWRNEKVYSPELLPKFQYDYVIIANTYYEEIIADIRTNKTVDESKIINWIKFRECIYHYSEEIWELFLYDFLKKNFYFIRTPNRNIETNLTDKLNKYNKIFIYDLRLIDSELDIGLLIQEILDNVKHSKIGMLFIPNESNMEENWYHNLLYVLGKNAMVLWSNLEGEFLKYIKENPERFSFHRFSILQFTRMQKRTASKGKYMYFEIQSVFEKNRDLIKSAKHIKIYTLRSDRIGEEIRILNKILFDNQEKDTFTLYIPIDDYSRPYVGVNACFNELVGRRIHLLKNQNEYALWIQNIFEESEKYEYDRSWIDFSNVKCGVREMGCPILDFEEDEFVFGKNLIEEYLGLTKDYVCLFTRDAQYLKDALPYMDCRYHNYRDDSFKKMDKVIDYLDGCGIQTIRVGQVVKQEEIHNKCIDLNRQGYDEFLDLSLHRNCKFFLGTGSGIMEIANLFGKPVACFLPVYPIVDRCLFYVKGDLAIFNRIFDVEKGRELSFSELFEVAFDFMCQSDQSGDYFRRKGFEMIPFSQEDYLNIAIEMNEKLDEVWKCSEEDKDLLNDFKLKIKLFLNQHNLNDGNIWQMSVALSYLRKYKYLLEK